MKKVFRFLFCTILICAALAEFTSCKKGIPTYDVNPQDIDLADLEWDLKFWGTEADLNTYSWTCRFTDTKTMPKMVNFKAGNLILRNNTGKFISNIMVYNSKGQAIVSDKMFQNNYPDGTNINLGAYKCSEDIIVKFKMDGQTYVYNLNKYVKTIFKEDVTLYAANDFKVEN